MQPTGIHPPASFDAALILADGSLFFGSGIGSEGAAFGEICFNTGMTGYQETLTDPSYAGQIITFTFPHIGNVGTNAEDIESRKIFACGLVVRAAITNPSNFRSALHLNAWLKERKVTGISGLDTRALTRHIRSNGAQNGAIAFFGDRTRSKIKAMRETLAAWPSMEGLELASKVTCEKPYEWTESEWRIGSGYGTLKSQRYHVVAVDFGAKLNILRCLAERGCKVTVVPAYTKAKEIMAYQPDGLFLSNGPGDPSQTARYATPMIQEIIKTGLPVFGICLGHQLLALALGGRTEKLQQGHRGANHPVKNCGNRRVEITSQNHGFVVLRDSLPKGVMETHVSLFDGTNEGLRLEGKPVFSVQHHPEAGPGPKDSSYLFDRFVAALEAGIKVRRSAAVNDR